MEVAALDWLARLGSRAFTFSLVGFVALNSVAFFALYTTRDRTLVNRWTGRLLAANLVLAGTGVGVPLLTSLARLAITSVSSGGAAFVPSLDNSREDDPIPAAARRGNRP
ncbi:MAG: hypothetical protein ABIZ91_18765 [Gemmatimonadaceae bacterium]